MGCPDHDMLHRMLLDQLDEEERQAVQAHFDACASCHEQMLVLVQSSQLDLAEDGAPEDQPEQLEMDPSDAQDPRPELLAGTRVGGFVVVRPLASGGMGSVYVAAEERTGLERALKVMHAPLAREPELQRRFLREAQVATRIRSEHVVQVVAAGVDGPGHTPWLAMELLPGVDLQAYVDVGGALPESRVEAFMAQISDALAAAHEQGIVHRDLKPQNLFVVEKPGAAPTIKLLDFGIAKIVVDGTFNTTGAMGSPAWMAPEQCSPGRSVRPATDVWALGLLAFYMHAGRSFWLAMNGRGGVGSLMREMLFDDLPRGSDRARRLGVSFPRRLDAWLASCLTRSPSDRIADGRLAHEAYCRALLRREASAPAGGPSARGRGLWLGAALLVAGGGAAAYLLDARRTTGGTEGSPEAVARGPSPDSLQAGRRGVGLARDHLGGRRYDEAEAVARRVLQELEAAGVEPGGAGASLAAEAALLALDARARRRAQEATLPPWEGKEEEVERYFDALKTFDLESSRALARWKVDDAETCGRVVSAGPRLDAADHLLRGLRQRRYDKTMRETFVSRTRELVVQLKLTASEVASPDGCTKEAHRVAQRTRALEEAWDHLDVP